MKYRITPDRKWGLWLIEERHSWWPFWRLKSTAPTQLEAIIKVNRYKEYR